MKTKRDFKNEEKSFLCLAAGAGVVGLSLPGRARSPTSWKSELNNIPFCKTSPDLVCIGIKTQ